jgi:dimethylsulfone monooxygenase
VSVGSINRHDGVGVMTHPDAPARIAAPTDFPDSLLSQALCQPMMLGLFLPIQAGGWSASRLPRTTDWSFDFNASLVRQAEDLGFDIVFWLSKWLPNGGYGDRRECGPG